MEDLDARRLLRRMFDAAIAAADPAKIIPRYLPSAPLGRTIVVGAGKASAAMARAFEQAWKGELSGIVVTRYGHAVPCRRIETIEAGHPVPDSNSELAARLMLAAVKGLSADDLVVALMSGGGSALLSAPAPGLTLSDKQVVNRALLASGATIGEMNCVRKHLSMIKGGRLSAAAYPARVVTLLISDVPGDDPAVVASGPTVADPTTFAEVRAIMEKYNIREPKSVIAHLSAGVNETPKPGDRLLARSESHIIAAPRASLIAAAEVARAAQVTPIILGDAIEGESRDVARIMAAAVRQVIDDQRPYAAPCVLLSGGETTVTLRGKGSGGRNVEFLLALAMALGGEERVWALAGDTDGVDGMEDVAGAIVTPDTLRRAMQCGLSAAECLADNDSHRFFQGLGDQIITGPTLTNVNDFRAMLIL